MKKIYNLILLGLVLIASSCSNEVLDVKPTTFVSDEAIWTEQGMIEQTLANIYGNQICAFNRRGDLYNIPAFSHIDLATDDGNGKIDAAIQMFNDGSITSSFTPFAEETWRVNYLIIRRANEFLEGIEIVDDEVLDADTKKAFTGEARFLRAFSYFQLVEMFGGVPLIKAPQALDDPNINLPRNSADEVYDFIADECDLASSELSVAPVSSGHASIGAALALKARALLYHASPLNNPSGDASRWSEAATAAKAVIDLGVYDLFSDYRGLFLTANEGNIEVIYDRQFGFPQSVHTIQATWGMWFTFDAGTWGGFSPSQNIVDAYEMTNGLPITDPASGYNSNDPYTDRDSRLGASIVYNGSAWRGNEVGYYQGGNADVNKEVNCGYGLKKFDEEIPIGTNFYDGSYAQQNNWIYFRYAEVLLNYAEAQNEAVGADNNVYNAINQVRRRAGQPDLPVGLSQSEMRERIWNERRVELVYEEHRFFDVRRWGKGMEVFNQPLKEAVIVDNGDGTFTYSYQNKETRTYHQHFDFMPIPLSEIERNPNLTNDPAWN